MHNSADEVLYSMTETHKCKPLEVEMLSDVEYARNRSVNFLKAKRKVNNYLQFEMIAMHDLHLLEGSLSDCHCRPVDGQAVVDLCLDVYRIARYLLIKVCIVRVPGKPIKNNVNYKIRK